MNIDRQCPKCGGFASGPAYEVALGGSERLRYKCGCGYSWTRPTVDDPIRTKPDPTDSGEGERVMFNGDMTRPVITVKADALLDMIRDAHTEDAQRIRGWAHFYHSLREQKVGADKCLSAADTLVRLLIDGPPLNQYPSPPVRPASADGREGR